MKAIQKLTAKLRKELGSPCTPKDNFIVYTPEGDYYFTKTRVCAEVIMHTTKQCNDKIVEAYKQEK